MKKVACLILCVAFALSIALPSYAVTITRERGMQYQGGEKPKINPASIKQKTASMLGKTSGEKLGRTPGGSKAWAEYQKAQYAKTAQATGLKNIQNIKTKILNKIERKD